MPGLNPDNNIGSFNDHIETANKGIKEFKIWKDLTHATISMSKPNLQHRIDITDREMLKKIEEKMNMKIDYVVIDEQIKNNSFLTQAFGFKVPIDITKDDSGKSLSKKQIKINAKKEKIMKKINVLQEKYDKMKEKSGPRGIKLKQKIDFLQNKHDRIL